MIRMTTQHNCQMASSAHRFPLASSQRLQRLQLPVFQQLQLPVVKNNPLVLVHRTRILMNSWRRQCNVSTVLLIRELIVTALCREESGWFTSGWEGLAGIGRSQAAVRLDLVGTTMKKLVHLSVAG